MSKQEAIRNAARAVKALTFCFVLAMTSTATAAESKSGSTNATPESAVRMSRTVPETQIPAPEEHATPFRSILLLVLAAFAGGFWSAWALFGRKRIPSGGLGSGQSPHPMTQPSKPLATISLPPPPRILPAVPTTSPEPSNPASTEMASDPVPAGRPSSVSPASGCVAWPTAPKSGEGISADWASFVSDRLAETNPAESSDDTKWALGVVDFLDELKESEKGASEVERKESGNLSDHLKAALAAKGFELVDSEEWNPERQRAVAVSRKPDAISTKILGKGSTGLSHNGKIIRKQEVKIETKGN